MEHDQRKTKTILDRSGGNSGDSALYFHRRRNRNAPVELAAANVVRLASDYLLAGHWNSGAVPHPFWRAWFPWAHALQFSPPHAGAHGRALGTDDARRTRTDA